MPRWTSCNICVLINSCQRPPKPHGVSEGRESELNKSLESSLRGDTVGVELFGCVTCYRRLDSDKKKQEKSSRAPLTEPSIKPPSAGGSFCLFVRPFVCLFYSILIKPHLYPLIRFPWEWELTLGIKGLTSTLVLTLHLAGKMCDLPIKGNSSSSVVFKLVTNAKVFLLKTFMFSSATWTPLVANSVLMRRGNIYCCK